MTAWKISGSELTPPGTWAWEGGFPQVSPGLFLAEEMGGPHLIRTMDCQLGEGHTAYSTPHPCLMVIQRGGCCQEQGRGQENFICLESDRKKEAWKFQGKLGSVPVLPLFALAQLAPVSELGVH